MKACLAVCLLLGALAGCGGAGDRPDLAAPQPTTTKAAPIPAETTSTTTAPASVARPVSPPSSTELRRVAAQASSADAAVRRWDAAIDACVGPSGNGDDAGASCTRTAWDGLFDQMYAVQYELLAIMDRMPAGACRTKLSSALDSVHGFLSGATPLKVVWLDEQQRPPMLFDLEAIVDVARPAGARMRGALASPCRA